LIFVVRIEKNLIMMMFAIGEWWELLSTPQQVFWALGAGGTGILVLQTLLSFVGMDVDTDVDFDLSTEISLEFGLFSFKSIVAFVAFFGWTGVIALGYGWSMPLVILASVGSGLIAMLLVAYMLFQFQKLESSGTMRIEEAVLEEAEVYLAIPAAGAGKGQITIELNGGLQQLRAVTKGDLIPTGATVIVIDVLEENVLLVEPVLNLKPGDEI
jgi:membrane protein implicated in regulation of membrane protease activity